MLRDRIGPALVLADGLRGEESILYARWWRWYDDEGATPEQYGLWAGGWPVCCLFVDQGRVAKEEFSGIGMCLTEDGSLVGSSIGHARRQVVARLNKKLSRLFGPIFP